MSTPSWEFQVRPLPWKFLQKTLPRKFWVDESVSMCDRQRKQGNSLRLRSKRRQPVSMYLKIGTILKDAQNEYIVRDMEHRNTHSQFPSAYLVECYSGPNEGKARWVSAEIALQYQGEWKK